MSQLKISQNLKHKIDDICENYIIKTTKKIETEQAYQYIENNLIDQILKNLHEKNPKSQFTVKYTYEEDNQNSFNFSNSLFEKINYEYLEELCLASGIKIDKQINYNNRNNIKFILVTFTLIYNYTPPKNLPKIKKKELDYI